MKILSVIPARAGSKGLPGKNLRPLLGKPLLLWSVEQALACSYSDSVVVSTDCPEMARLAQAHGARVPYLRPAHLAQDGTPTVDVLFDLIDRLAEQGEHYDGLLLLEPTSPLREVQDLEKAARQLIQTPSAQSIVGVCAVESAHPQFLVRLNPEGFLSSYGDGFSSSRRQDIEPLYFFEGSLYLSQLQALRQYRSFYHEKTLGYPMERWKALEIDEWSDFVTAELLMQAFLEGKLKGPTEVLS